MLAEYGLTTGRIRGRSGVWLAADGRRLERKIAAIGVRVATGTTMHGFALNVDPDLRSFDRIIPCGFTDVGVTSMTTELGRHAHCRRGGAVAPSAPAALLGLRAVHPVARYRSGAGLASAARGCSWCRLNR